MFCLSCFFGFSKFLLLCMKPPSSVQTELGNFLNFSPELEETLALRLIKKNMLYHLIFHMISKSLNLSLFAIYKLIKHPLPSKRHGGNFLNFSSELEDTLNDEIDHKRKICPSIWFFDLIPQSLNLSLFAIYKLINRPLPSKRHGEISWIFPQS